MTSIVNTQLNNRSIKNRRLAKATGSHKATNSKLKNLGIYYTPEFVSKIICQKLLHNMEFKKILEPSCGDGSFIKYLNLKNLKQLTAVEKDLRTARSLKLEYRTNKIKVINDDFLNYFDKNKKKRFDLIVGNPPFIKYNLMTKKQIGLGKSILTALNVNPNIFNNCWELFLILSLNLLETDGTICFILPYEMLQTNYAEKLKKYSFSISTI